ncbi:hypothetical protein C10C_0914 [Chlamydia serpentis]|uniref:Uncharacterized protein n=1 Tax=Chlamydia serpentis TaxID=1967782 RepID=A0A2R8FCG3_9CHLA|nr:hypothetical protein [Chlamydia serpentis]SPN74051.1 hypothetical protein C10C_0914 [Chlamydia serpentis]
MKSFKFLLPFLSLMLCCGNALLSSSHSQAISLTEAIGVSAAKTLLLSETASELIREIGYGFGISRILYDWQTQQWLEIESLIAQNEVV